MRLTTAVLAIGMAMGTAWAQSVSIVDQTRQKLAGVQQQQTAASNQALAATQGQAGGGAVSVSHSAPAALKPAAAASQPAPGKAPSSAPASNVKKPPVAVPPILKAKEPGGKQVAKGPFAKAGPSAIKPMEAKPEALKEEPTPKDEPTSISIIGRRDPFLSPVVSRLNVGSGCSSGKKCLAVDQIALTGIVKADGGLIAVVVNAANKAYFLRENDPVFNGYVVKITGDSIVFKETKEDNLGKPVTREVTKKITTPAV